MKTTKDIIMDAVSAKSSVALAGSEVKNRALAAMADAIMENSENILEANALDMEAAKGHISDVMLDRLALSKERIEGMARGICEVMELPDPVNTIINRIERPNGLVIEKTAAPLGVIAIIYESRPNVTADAAALSLKAGSSCILRCGKEAWRSAYAIVSAMRKGLSLSGLPETAISIVEDTTRNSANELMTAAGKIDLLIPRGGAALIKTCMDNATVPIIETGTGICHIYVDAAADMGKALNIVENAKTSRPSVCNSCEVCLVHRDIAGEFLPKLHTRLVNNRLSEGKPPVELRLDEIAASYIDGVKAAAQDFDTEFLDYILAVKVVSDLSEAISHLGLHSTHHSDAIITEDSSAAKSFTAQVDSAAVYVNASTRFTDGGEFGLGCEMGISTQKLHARGPMGLMELCTYKYIIKGNGQIR